MLSRSALGRVSTRLPKVQCLAIGTRGLADAASGSFTYQVGDVSGVKHASRDIPGPTTTLSVVAKAGTRYQSAPGLSEALEKFAFKKTGRRSALRIQREAELLGGELSATHTRENLILTARFLREDLPYFTELLGEVVTLTQFTQYELDEEVLPSIKNSQKHVLKSTTELAENSLHALAFHRGLGVPVNPTSSTPLTKYIDLPSIGLFAAAAYDKSNFAVVANGAEHAEFSKWVGEFFKDSGAEMQNQLKQSGYPGGVPTLTSEQSKYYGGEERIAHDGGNTIILGFPGSSVFTGKFFKPEISVIAALLGGHSNIKWSSGFSLLSKAAEPFSNVKINTQSLAYSDAGLLTVTITGGAKGVRDAAKSAVDVIKSVAAGKISGDDFKKAVAAAKFKALENGQNVMAGIELTGTGLIAGGKAHQIDEFAKAIEGVSEAQLKKVAKTLLEGKASVSSVGDLYVLPYAEELGLSI